MGPSRLRVRSSRLSQATSMSSDTPSASHACHFGLCSLYHSAALVLGLIVRRPIGYPYLICCPTGYHGTMPSSPWCHVASTTTLPLLPTSTIYLVTLCMAQNILPYPFLIHCKFISLCELLGLTS